ncbi:hypothetical protein GNF76_17060 [Pseudomonas sp. CCM 7893]|uniref:Oligosaccharide repeat unit polymerase n=1 Tax=Pseudomonas spelaei TaxID=1055469 RepID=A0A6I3WDU3_9PSED|nr:hypothetical protein [Pseudomonas spelaei]MUF06064.1 hypothetical protein [Pseudomonas spelaei]
MYLLPVLAMAIFYILPSLLGVFFGERDQAPVLLFLSVLSILSYLLFYILFSGYWFSRLLNTIPKLPMSWRVFNLTILGIYFAVILYASLTAPGIALFAAFKGVGLAELSGLREEFLRTREGSERILTYIYAIGVTSLVPLVITQMFVDKARRRFWVLFAFIFTLLLTLEKGRALVAMIPLIILFVNVGKKNKAYLSVFYLVIVIATVSVLARGALTSADAAPAEESPMASVPVEYNLFPEETSQFYYLINRVMYIPYLTAIDWLRYKDEVLSGESVSGRSIGLIAFLMGEPKINLEQEVFAFEWGQNETGTGSANTVFYVDAFLNFGYFGVILYSAILALFVRICIRSGNTALCACLGISICTLTLNALPAVLFSGGLAFLVFIALFFKGKRPAYLA